MNRTRHSSYRPSTALVSPLFRRSTSAWLAAYKAEKAGESSAPAEMTSSSQKGGGEHASNRQVG